MNNTIYELRLYNQPLLSFYFQDNFRLTTHIEYIDEASKHLLPLDLTPTDKGLMNWLKERIIPRNRDNYEAICASANFGENRIKNIFATRMALSLTDSYWIVPQNFQGRFEDYNFFENEFSEDIALVAFTGVINNRIAPTALSPEFTTDGTLKKAWRRIDDIYLYKGGTYGASNSGKEPYSEYYAYQIAKAMGLNAVAYDLEYWENSLASKCKLFTDIDTSFVPIGAIMDSNNLSECLEIAKSISKDCYDDLCSMFVFDAVIYNEDRHFGNFGLLRDNHTGKLTGMAPIFDNGFSLFCFATEEKLNNLPNYAKGRSNPYDVPYETICKHVMTDKQVKQLENLLDFKFERHPMFNLPEERLQTIESFISIRVNDFLTSK